MTETPNTWHACVCWLWWSCCCVAHTAACPLSITTSSVDASLVCVLLLQRDHVRRPLKRSSFSADSDSRHKQGAVSTAATAAASPRVARNIIQWDTIGDHYLGGSVEVCSVMCALAAVVRCYRWWGCAVTTQPWPSMTAHYKMYGVVAGVTVLMYGYASHHLKRTPSASFDSQFSELQPLSCGRCVTCCHAHQP